MRIISDFHDYYDSVQAMGQDQSLVYVRKRTKIGSGSPNKTVTCEDAKLVVRDHTIGFCGRSYTVLLLSTGTGRRTQGQAVCYSMEEVDTFMKQHYTDEEIAGFSAVGKQRRRTWSYWRWPERTREQLARRFIGSPGITDKLFVEHGCPVYVRHPSGVVVNDCLKPFEFYRIFDTYTAFQEIAMYLGGVLGAANPKIPEISNADMITAKGFDKWSFRKEPGKKARSHAP